VYVIFANEGPVARRSRVPLYLLRRLYESRRILDQLNVANPSDYSLMHLTVHCTRREMDLLNHSPERQFTQQQLKWIAWHASDNYYQQVLGHYTEMAKITPGQQVEMLNENIDALVAERAKFLKPISPVRMVPVIEQPIDSAAVAMDWDDREPDISSDEYFESSTPMLVDSPPNDPVDLADGQSELNRAFVPEPTLGEEEEEEEEGDNQDEDERYGGGDAEPFSSDESVKMRALFNSTARRFVVKRKRSEQSSSSSSDNHEESDDEFDRDQHSSSEQASSDESDNDENPDQPEPVSSIKLQWPVVLNPGVGNLVDTMDSDESQPRQRRPLIREPIREVDWDHPRFSNGAPGKVSDAQEYMSWEQDEMRIEAGRDYWYWLHNTGGRVPSPREDDEEWREFKLRFASMIVPSKDQEKKVTGSK